jgi:hypothetical protein
VLKSSICNCDLDNVCWAAIGINGDCGCSKARLDVTIQVVISKNYDIPIRQVDKSEAYECLPWYPSYSTPLYTMELMSPFVLETLKTRLAPVSVLRQLQFPQTIMEYYSKYQSHN